ncbi:MAG: prolyl oligopeptidase family serine peptidase [Armatimonadetes bacterium]|nr:prolyl oligopeptidase family serine peptidase [Armatimonadota bacterium]
MLRSLLPLLLATAALADGPFATGLAAGHRAGQVFLTWHEPPGIAGNPRMTVLIADRPITAAARATALTDRLLPGSAADWWLNPETYGNPVPPGADGRKPGYPHEGWRIDEGGANLDPDSGLYVHTVTEATAGPRYYAVVGGDGLLVRGVNSLAEPVDGRVAPIEPIWQGDPAGKPRPGAGNGLPLDLTLHAKTGRGGMEWLVFGDGSLGWREGLPFKLGCSVRGGAVLLAPTDRTWTGRPLEEDADGCQKLTPAIHTFWFGYFSEVVEPGAKPTVVVNYSERKLLWMLRWAQAYFGTDPNRTYCSGSSMGGCGTMSFAYRHPELFAAVSAHVPIVTYSRASAYRVTAYCGPLDTPYCEGGTVGERLDARRFVLGSGADLPFLVIANGRNDGSIPWPVNPDFYRALDQRRQGCLVAWNEGDHGGTDKLLPPDVRERMGFAYLHRYALNSSYLAFGHSSLDNDPGDGPKDHGETQGFLHRGLEHDPPSESAERYEVVIRWYLPAQTLPVTVDVTPRRVQAFKPRPGSTVTAVNVDLGSGQVVQRLTADVGEDGLVTVQGVHVTSPAGHRLTLTGGG